jgi:hypothetical protein
METIEVKCLTLAVYIDQSKEYHTIKCENFQIAVLMNCTEGKKTK